MAEFGDVMDEFHKLPLVGKLAVGGAVVAVAAIAYARYRAQASSSGSSTVGIPTGDSGGSVSSNALDNGAYGPTPTSSGASSATSSSSTATSLPNNGPTITISGTGAPAGVGSASPAHAAQTALHANIQSSLTPAPVVSPLAPAQVSHLALSAQRADNPTMPIAAGRPVVPMPAPLPPLGRLASIAATAAQHINAAHAVVQPSLAKLTGVQAARVRAANAGPE